MRFASAESMGLPRTFAIEDDGSCLAPRTIRLFTGSARARLAFASTASRLLFCQDVAHNQKAIRLRLLRLIDVRCIDR